MHTAQATVASTPATTSIPLTRVPYCINAIPGGRKTVGCLAPAREKRKHFTVETILAANARPRKWRLLLVPFSDSGGLFSLPEPELPAPLFSSFSHRNAKLSGLIFRLCRIPRCPTAGSLLAFSRHCVFNNLMALTRHIMSAGSFSLYPANGSPTPPPSCSYLCSFFSCLRPFTRDFFR